MRVSQCDQIVEYMHKHGSITHKEAERELGCMRLASRINDLKKRGYAIRREMIKVKNRYGESVPVAKYSLLDVDEN